MCSQCMQRRQFVPVVRIARDPRTGMLTENGAPVTSRAFVARTPTPRNVKPAAGQPARVRRKPVPDLVTADIIDDD